jgi:hypothetical protein
MKFSHSAFVLIFVFYLLGCSDLGTPPIPQFADGFYEAGSDSDHSYVSLQTTRLSNADLLIQVTGWGYYETGLFLSSEKEAETLTLRVTGMCGTVPTFTWAKVSFSHTITASEEGTVNMIRVLGGGTEILLHKQ